MASAGLNQKHIRLAQSLPPRLLNFFKKYPPPALRTPAAATTTKTTTTTTTTAIDTTSPQDANAAEATAPAPAAEPHNPFLPFRNPSTNRWHSPRYSLRTQASLVKLASTHNVLSLLPFSTKLPEVRAAKRREQGLRTQGTGEGKRVKGKMWERTLKGRLEERRRAMEGMAEMVKVWKERGHGRGWKKWPK